MPGRFVRSKIAENVAEIMNSRQGRQALERHGWVQGMPIVMAQPEEKLSDAMALVCVHEPPVLLATLEPLTDELCFTHIVVGCSALEPVEIRDEASTTRDLYLEALQRKSFLTFRVNGHVHSSVAHALPPIRVPQPSYRPFGVPTAGTHG